MRQHIFILLIIGCTLLTRFFNLMWGNGYFFHPDENNMARAITHISREKTLDPDFFAYGQFPLYLAAGSFHASDAVKHIVQEDRSPSSISHADAVFWLRFWSAVSSSMSVGVFFLIIRRMTNQTIALFGSTLMVFAPSLIQFSHYGTTESILGLLLLSIIGYSVRLIDASAEFKSSSQILVLLGFLLGFSVGLKLSSIYFSVPVLASSIWYLRSYLRHSVRTVAITILTTMIAMLIGYGISSPYNIVNFDGFLGSMRYEVAVAQGLDVFYTRQFIDTNTLTFYLGRIFPYALGWPLFVLGSLSLLYALIQIVSEIWKHNYAKNQHTRYFLLLCLTITGYMVPILMLKIRWTRLVGPLIPIIILLVSYSLYHILHTRTLSMRQFILLASGSIAIFPGMLLFTVYIHDDVRIQASEYIYENIPDQSYILSETANVVDIPVPLNEQRTKSYTVISFDFYHLDQELNLQPDLIHHLENADYILVPSRRIFANYLRFPDRYPHANRYYEALFDGSLGFDLIALCTYRGCGPPLQTRYFAENYLDRASYIDALLVNDERAEETFSVFDHPVVRIFKKSQNEG